MSEHTDLVIRPLQQADVHAVLEIIRTVRREYGLGEPREYSLFDLYRRRRSAYFVAVEGREVVGGAGIARLADADWLTCEVQKMYLRSQNRRQGIGQLLLDACIDAAHAFHFKSCYAETISAMTAALAFYERNGFQRLESPVGLTGHNHNDCWMMLNIVPPQSTASTINLYTGNSGARQTASILNPSRSKTNAP